MHVVCDAVALAKYTDSLAREGNCVTKGEVRGGAENKILVKMVLPSVRCWLVFLCVRALVFFW